MLASHLLRGTGAALVTTLLVACLPAQAVPAAPPSFSSLVVFGDSLSDNGNLFALSEKVFGPGKGVPSAPYYQGRFSNGPVAVEYLASGLGLSGAQFQDLAIAGAKTGTGGQFNGTGMLSQLAGFQAALGGAPASSTALYFVWGGANDLRADPTSGAATIGNLVNIVSTLYSMGARNFFLPNLPDLGLTPEAREAGVSGPATAGSESFNAGLSNAYAGLAASWSDEHFYTFDAMAAQRAITNGSPGNGFSNVTSACFQTSPISVCGTPDTYLYWDQIHPTAAAHAILGAQMLAAVPEPQTMLMMAVGVLVLLGASRRRQA